MELSVENEIQVLYQQLIDAWNIRSAEGMSEVFTAEGELIGFDGSHVSGKANIFTHLQPIFENHPTPPFISIVEDVRLLSLEVARLRAIVGMVPPGKVELDPTLNARQTLIAVKEKEIWRVELFQNTPAQLHGRPDLVEQMTEKLRQVRK